MRAIARTPESIASAVESFIRREFRVPASDGSFHRDVHLYDSGFVDSVGVIELIAFLESTFDVELQEEDIFSDDFTSINGISRVAHRRLSTMALSAVPTDASGPTSDSNEVTAVEPERGA